MTKTNLFLSLVIVVLLFVHANNDNKKELITAQDEITLSTGSSSIVMKKDGSILIKGNDITIQSNAEVNIKTAKYTLIKGGKLIDN